MRKDYVLNEEEHSEYLFLKAMSKKLKSLSDIELCDRCKKLDKKV